jgi:hypothetical protein
MTIRTLPSLARCSDRPLRFLLHDDGSLLPGDCDRLRAALGDVTILGRASADEIVEPLLAGSPCVRRFRRRNPLALKLLDVMLCAGGEDLAYCDTDVLAFRPLTALWDWPDTDTAAVFMPDEQNAYALRPWHLVGPDAINVPLRVNTGLMLVRAMHYDLDFIEWLLAREFGVYARIPGWVEQTCWAALGQRINCRLYDPSQVRVMRSAACFEDDAILVGHFTSSVRGLWRDAPTTLPAPAGPIAVKTVASSRLTTAGLARDHLRRAATRCRAWMTTAASREQARSR